MSILPASGVGDVSTGFYPHEIDQSLRFDGSTSKFEKTPSSDGNRKKWTSSWWVKRAKLGALQYMWSGASYYGNDGIAALYFESDDKIHMYFDANTHPYGPINNRVYRDVSQWYHIVWAVDAVNTVAKVWVNGVEESNGIQPPNFSYGMNKASTKMGFGFATWGGSPNYDGYLAEFVHLDGQYLDETYFGEFINGVWVPKNIHNQNFTFGTNGFYLPFSDSNNIGYDYQTSDRSGTTNDYTVSGLASTDVVPDSCTNNFSTLNKLDARYGTLAEGNLSNTYATTGELIRSTFAQKSGKWYAEVNCIAGSGFNLGIYPTGNLNKDSDTNYGCQYRGATGQKVVSNSVSSYGATYGVNDIIGIAVDMDNNTVTFYKNNSSQGSISYTIDEHHAFSSYISSGNTAFWNFGQDSSFGGNETAQGNTDGNGEGDFYYTPPSGYLALCSANLPDTTISPNQSTQADDHFNTVLYTGNGASQSITGVGFQPDWLWFKARNEAIAGLMYDSSRGATKYLQVNSSNAEGTGADSQTSFDADGFSVGADTSTTGVNKNSTTYVAWCWKINGGTTSTNTEGSLSCTVQANTDAGISIVTWNGDGNTSVTLGHGLEKKPELIIYKGRDNSFAWPTWFKTFGTSTGSFISTNNTPGSFARVMSEPTDTVIPNAEKNYTNVSGENSIAYVFHSVIGYSKIDSYTGNGSTDGTFVFTGFRPAWILVKTTSIASDWVMEDTTRSPFNESNATLFANLSNAEYTGGAYGLDFLSNGFKVRNTYNQWNANNQSYLYMAFAEQPFKFSNAR